MKQAVSEKINRDYVIVPARVDSERAAREGPNIFKRIDSDAYVLMIDVYGARPHTIGFTRRRTS